MSEQPESHRAPLSDELKDDVRRIHREAEEKERTFSFEVLFMDLEEKLKNASYALRFGIVDHDKARELTDAAIAQYLHRMRSR